jgi:preprotein translocase SecE subunit
LDRASDSKSEGCRFESCLARQPNHVLEDYRQMDKIKGYFNQSVSFVKEAWSELSKVHYPTPRDTLRATAVVVVVSLLMAAWLGVIDFFATRIVRQLLS